MLFANLDADFHLGISVIGTTPFRFRQLVANDLAWQSWIEGLADTFLAGMPGNLNAGFDGDFLGHRPGRSQGFGFIEEVRLSVAARLALGGKEFAQEDVEFLLEQITLDLDDLGIR